MKALSDWIDEANKINNFTGWSRDIYDEWEDLIDVVEFIEDLDLKEYHYQWEDNEGVHYNFDGLEFEITLNQAYVWVELSLDPSKILVSVVGDDKKDAVLKCILEFIDYYNGLIENN